MKKRIFALLTALIMLASVFMLASCEDEDKSNSSSAASDSTSDSSGNLSDDTIATPVDPPTAKELFELSFKNTFAPVVNGEEADEDSESAIPSFPSMNNVDMESTIAFNVNKLTLQGTDYIGEAPMSVVMSGFQDITLNDDGTSDVKFITKAEANLFGDKIPLALAYDNGNYVITDVMGLNDKAIILDSIDTSAMESSFDSIGQYEELFGAMISAFEAAIDANLTDDAFVNENKDVTVDGTEFKSADVITLTITSETAQNIAKSALESLRNNDAVKDLFGEALDEENNDFSDLEDLTALKLSITVASEKIVAADLTIESMVEDYTADDDFGFDFGALSAEEETKKIADTFTLSASFVNDVCKIHLAPSLNEDEAVVDITASYTEADGKVSVAVDITENKKTTTILKVEGIYNNNKFDGKFTLDANGILVSIDVSYEWSETSVKLSITNLAMENSGTSISIPAEITFEETVTDGTKFDAKVTFKLEAFGNIIDMDLAMYGEVKDVTLESINLDDCINESEIDDNTYAAWGEKLAELYPNLFSAIQEFSQMQGESLPGYDMGYGQY